MKNCSYPKCKFPNLPDEALYCPKCGTMLFVEQPQNKMTIPICKFVPSSITEGESAQLIWEGNEVHSLLINENLYFVKENIVMSPKETSEYSIVFVGNNGERVYKQLTLNVKEKEKTSLIVFIKEELSRINAYDSDMKNLRLLLNGKLIANIDMRPYFQTKFVVKKDDVIKIVGEQASGFYWDITLFEKKITDQILSKGKYYLEYTKKMFAGGEVDFHAARN